MRLLLLSIVLCLNLPAHAQTADTPPAESAEPAMRATLPSRAELYEQALQRALPASEQRQLDFNGKSRLGLFLPAARPAPLGGVLLIAAPGEHANWPELIAPARRSLSDAGWHTLAISLPDTPAAPRPDTQTSTETTEEPDQQQQITATYASEVTELIRVAWQILRSEGCEQITVITRGSAGYWALRAASPVTAGDPPATLVLYRPRSPAENLQPDMDSLLQAWDKPLLEMLGQGNALGRQLARDHLLIARRSGNQGYEQVDIDPMNQSALAGQMLDKRLLGWLKDHTMPVTEQSVTEQP